MPDSFEHMPPIAVRMPNGALTSLAGNVDPQHTVTIGDLILVQGRVRELVRALDHKAAFDGIAGLSFNAGERWHHSPDRSVHTLDDGEVRLPNRNARAIHGYTFLGKQVDVIETSRGCTFDCSFCSIIE